MLTTLTQSVAGCVSASGSGPYTLTFADGTSRLATAAEVLQAERASVIARIKAYRDEYEQTRGYPVTFEGVGALRFHNDALAVRHLQEIFLEAVEKRAAGAGDDAPMDGAAFNPGWKCMGRTQRVPMTVGRTLALRSAAKVWVGAVHVAAATHEYFVSQHPAPLTYDFSAGWPE